MPEIRPVRASDHDEWLRLWNGYQRFYRQHLASDVIEASFARLADERVQPHGLIAARDGRLIGFAHYVFHPTTWSLHNSCYLEDLFVDPGARGSGVGRGLIHAVYAAADQANAAAVYWMTQEFNAEGRALYDTLARRTSFIRYERG